MLGNKEAGNKRERKCRDRAWVSTVAGKATHTLGRDDTKALISTSPVYNWGTGAAEKG